MSLAGFSFNSLHEDGINAATQAALDAKENKLIYTIVVHEDFTITQVTTPQIVGSVGLPAGYYLMLIGYKVVGGVSEEVDCHIAGATSSLITKVIAPIVSYEHVLFGNTNGFLTAGGVPTLDGSEATSYGGVFRTTVAQTVNMFGYKIGTTGIIKAGSGIVFYKVG